MNNFEKLIQLNDNLKRAEYIYDNLPVDITTAGYHSLGKNGIIEEIKTDYITKLYFWLKREVDNE